MEWGWRRFYSIIEFGVKNGVGLEMPLPKTLIQKSEASSIFFNPQRITRSIDSSSATGTSISHVYPSDCSCSNESSSSVPL